MPSATSGGRADCYRWVTQTVNLYGFQVHPPHCISIFSATNLHRRTLGTEAEAEVHLATPTQLICTALGSLNCPFRLLTRQHTDGAKSEAREPSALSRFKILGRGGRCVRPQERRTPRGHPSLPQPHPVHPQPRWMATLDLVWQVIVFVCG